jgi:hypothetical protein
MLDYLKKQVFEFRSKNFLLRNDLRELKHSYHHLAEQYSALTSSHEALKQHSNNLSGTNKKNLSVISENKKTLFEIKKELKLSLFQHKAEMRKLTGLMRAKEKDSAETIRCLEAELAASRRIASGSANCEKKEPEVNRSGISSSSSAQIKQQPPSKKNGKATQSKNFEPIKKRANFGRKSPVAIINTSPRGIDADLWGCDKFGTQHGYSSATNFSVNNDSSGVPSRRQKKKHSGHDKKPSTDAKKTNIRKNHLQDLNPNLMTRKISTPSLKETMKKKNNGAVEKKSSLAAAVAKTSSLIQAKNKKN